MPTKGVLLFVSDFNIFLDIDKKFNLDEAVIIVDSISEQDKKKMISYFDLTQRKLNILNIRSSSNFDNLLIEISEKLTFREGDRILLFINHGDSHISFAVFIVLSLFCYVYDTSLELIFLNRVEGDKISYVHIPDLTKLYALTPQDLEIIKYIEEESIGEIAERLNISPATVSIRLRALQSLGIIKIHRRNRQLQRLGQILNIISKNVIPAREQIIINSEEIVDFVLKSKRLGGFASSPQTRAADLKSTVFALAILILLGQNLPDLGDLDLSIGVAYHPSGEAIMTFKYSKFFLSSQYIHRLGVLLKYYPQLNEYLSLEELIRYINKLKKAIDYRGKRLFGCSYRVREKNVSLISTYECIIAKYLFAAEIDYDYLGFLNACMHDLGGFKNLPTETFPDLTATYVGLALSRLYKLDLSEMFLENTKRYILSLWHDNGFTRPRQKTSTLWNNFDATLALLLIDNNIFDSGNQLRSIKKKLIELVVKRYRRGAFINVIGSTKRTVSYTYPALTILKLLGYKTEKLRFSDVDINTIIGYPGV